MDLQLDFPMSANMCSLAEGTHALQGPLMQATGLLKNPQLPLVPEEPRGPPISVFFSTPDPSSSKPTQTTHSSLKPLRSKVLSKLSQLAPSQLMSYSSAIFIQYYSHIIHPCNLPGPKLGINTYHVVICGQEVGVFYAE
jgi:hypothetical protein